MIGTGIFGLIGGEREKTSRRITRLVLYNY